MVSQDEAGTVLIVFCWLGRAADMAAATCTISSKWPKRITMEFPMPFPLHTKDGNFPSYLNHHDALDAKASGFDSGGMVLNTHRSKSPRFRRQTMLNLSARFSIPQGCCVPRKRNALANSQRNMQSVLVLPCARERHFVPSQSRLALG